MPKRSSNEAGDTAVEMACGLALKRPHEYDSYLAGDAPSEVKRARSALCSPFRPQMGTLAASLPSSSVLPKSLDDVGSPFASVSGRCQMSPAQLESYLRAEIRSLKRRKLIPKRAMFEEETTRDVSPKPNRGNNFRVPGSPQSGSDSEGECSANSEARRRILATLPTEVDSKKTHLYEKPMYSLGQVMKMCERLLSEQEMRIRFEYQQVLSTKLQEQHDQFRQFAAEQEIRSSEPTEDYSCSYLS